MAAGIYQKLRQNLDLNSLVIDISKAVINIVSGRKGFATRGKEQEGRILYETGIERAMSIFKESQTSKDPHALLLSEYTFITQEFQLCPKSYKRTISSLTNAIQSFDDAFLALKAVADPRYKIVDETFPHISKYRYDAYPKDSFHIACASHITRLLNNLSYTGLDPIENTLLEQRRENMTTAQKAYAELQKIIMGI